jgi:antitoxin CptB
MIAARATVDARVYWQCRRGMRELDVLLQEFFERIYESADEDVRRAFRELLEYPDQLLLEYLMGRMVPIEPYLADVVARIRNNVAD